MRYSFELPRRRRANVWLDEVPPAEFTPASKITRLIKPKVVVPAVRRVAALEMNIPHGPMASYALLGAELVEAPADGLEVVVFVNSAGALFAPSLALRSDETRVGLPEEYAGAVIAGVQWVANSSGVPTNVTVRFRWAAHGLAGSSRWALEEVSRIVMRLLALPRGVSEKQIEALFG
jgi:hypothetical protein